MFDFLTPLEVIAFQGTTKWMYDRGVERVQHRVKLPIPTYLTWYTEIPIGKLVIEERYPRNTRVRFV